MHSDIYIRTAEPQDAETIAEFNRAMAWETERTQLCVDTLVAGVRAILAKPQYGFYIVAETKEQVVGCLMVTFEWSDWRNGVYWWIQSLYIQPDFRRQGIFRKLHDFVKAKALRQGGVCAIRLYVEHSNHTAQQAYRQIGMSPCPYQMYEQTLPR